MPTTTPEKITKWVFHWLSTQRLSTDFQVFLLLGDGSTRSFYRIKNSEKTYILVSDSQWTQTQDYPVHQAFLATRLLPVPHFFASDPAAGFLLMEDLGDELLQHRILSSPNEKISWLEKSMELLGQLHGKTYPVPTALPVAGRAFDKEKYSAEFAFTLEHLNGGLLGLPQIDAAAQRQLTDFCASIAQISPLVFSHRDYHCRNLLLKDEKLVMIDFQDARLGSPHYDVASMLYDAYVPISIEERKALVSLYLSALEKFPLYKDLNLPSFQTELKQVAFQRVVKAAGSFASFYTRFKKATHLPYLVPALEYAHELQQSGHGVPEHTLPVTAWLARARALTIK